MSFLNGAEICLQGLEIARGKPSYDGDKARASAPAQNDFKLHACEAHSVNYSVPLKSCLLPTYSREEINGVLLERICLTRPESEYLAQC